MFERDCKAVVRLLALRDEVIVALEHSHIRTEAAVLRGLPNHHSVGQTEICSMPHSCNSSCWDE